MRRLQHRRLAAVVFIDQQIDTGQILHFQMLDGPEVLDGQVFESGLFFHNDVNIHILETIVAVALLCR